MLGEPKDNTPLRRFRVPADRIQIAKPLLWACGGPREFCATIEATVPENSIKCSLKPTCLGCPKRERQARRSQTHLAGIHRSGARPVFTANGEGGRIITVGRAGGRSKMTTRSVATSNKRIK